MPKHVLHNDFTAIIERDEEWHIGYCPEIPGANGQGKSAEECKENLADAIALILQDRREEAQRAGRPCSLLVDEPSHGSYGSHSETFGNIESAHDTGRGLSSHRAASW